jgi:hypothetical protein
LVIKPPEGFKISKVNNSIFLYFNDVHAICLLALVRRLSQSVRIKLSSYYISWIFQVCLDSERNKIHSRERVHDIYKSF